MDARYGEGSELTQLGHHIIPDPPTACEETSPRFYRLAGSGPRPVFIVRAGYFLWIVD
jgi:hypothetical protein